EMDFDELASDELDGGDYMSEDDAFVCHLPVFLPSSSPSLPLHGASDTLSFFDDGLEAVGDSPSSNHKTLSLADLAEELQSTAARVADLLDVPIATAKL